MKITRWTPPGALGLAFNDEMDRVLDHWFEAPRSRPAGNGNALFLPAVDIEETQDGFALRADLPGIDPKDVKVRIMGDTVTISGERKHADQKREKSLHRVERVYGVFERSFRLGVPVRADQVKATYKDGVLEVTIPKADEAKPREIEIQPTT